MPGTTIGEKTFTVSNTGNTLVKNYKVVLEYAVIDGVVPSVFVRPEDFEITLTCVSKNIETNEVSGICNGYTGTFDNESFEMTLNDIDEKIKHEYTLTIFYANPDIDQSDDMGKNLNLKVQIYGANETSTITGTIDNVDETYAMKLNSNSKISTIKNVGTKENPKYQYKFIGVEPNKDGESHKLTLVNKSNVEQSTGNIIIKKGTNANIDGSIITVKDNQTNIYLTTVNGVSLTNSATFNPYSNNTNSLAYHILDNSINNTNGTMLVDILPSKVASQASLKDWDLGIEENEYYFDETNISTYAETDRAIWNCYNGYYDEKVGSYVEDCSSVNIYDGCTADVEGKYIYNSVESETVYVYKCENNRPVVGYIKPEKVLSSTLDDYGISYYYRGKVIDNYVNFAGMCWRIVRIAGDSSVKLILEDQNAECDSDSYTGNWNVGFSNYGYLLDDSSGETILNYLKPETENTYSLVKRFYDFQLNKLEDYKSKLKNGDWCISNDAYLRLNNDIQNGYQTSLKCNGTILNNFETVVNRQNTIVSNISMYVGTLTVDEIMYAGGSLNNVNRFYYLISDYNFNNSYFWSITPNLVSSNSSFAYIVHPYGDVTTYDVKFSDIDNYDFLARPSINLKPNIGVVKGEGTQDNPYVIE